MLRAVTLRSDRVEEGCRAAVMAFERGELPIADSLARAVVAVDPGRAAMWNLLGRLALGAGRADLAVEFLEKAVALEPTFRPARKNLEKAKQTRAHPPPETGARFAVIKAWGSGFWSDVDHTIGGLLLAEISGRTPIVHWGANSRYRGAPGTTDVFREFFVPPNELGIADAQAAGAGGGVVFPPKWSGGDLAREGLNVAQGPYSQMGAVTLLGRPERMVVCDYHQSVVELSQWLPRGHRFEGKPLVEVYRALFAQHLRLQPAIAERVDAEQRRLIDGRPMVAVHFRGSDKIREFEEAAAEAAHLPALVDGFLARSQEAGVLLITDSIPAVEHYRQRYGNRLVLTECARTAGAVGLHFDRGLNGHTLGVEMIVDTYLASRCDWFVGVGSSNVPCAVLHLKDWEPGRCVLVGEVLQHSSSLGNYPSILKYADCLSA